MAILPDGEETGVKMTPSFCLSNLMNGEIRHGDILQQRIPEEGREDNKELTFGRIYLEILLEWISRDVAFGSRLAIIWN